MTLFRHKQNKKLYIVEHLKLDLRFLNGNAYSGIYACPYKWKGETISYTLDDFQEGKIDEFNPRKFVEENFIEVAELNYV